MEFLEFSWKPKLRNPTFLVCWEADAGQLGAGVANYLMRELNAELFCEIDPVQFFPLGGVAIENDVVQFPESSFYVAPDHELVIFYSTIPRYEWFHFLNLVMDMAGQQYRGKELYTIGGMVSLGAHTAPRDFWGTFNSLQIKKSLAQFQLSREMDFETPPGGRPTLNAFALWTARQRGIQGANLWIPIPFYLVNTVDPRGQKRILEFLDSRLGLNLDLREINNEITRQDKRLLQMRERVPETDRAISKLEKGERLNEEEHEALMKQVGEFLEKGKAR
jgi:proteasome assembly chaperone (PAC2) family protein